VPESVAFREYYCKRCAVILRLLQVQHVHSLTIERTIYDLSPQHPFIN